MTDLEALEAFRLNFTNGNLTLLNLCIAFIMFSVALNIKKEHFFELIRRPKPLFVGLISQLILLPFLAFALIRLLQVPTSLGMGIILVSVCPGGNVSNFYTLIAKGNTALSVTLTAIVTVLSIFTIPFLYSFWTNIAYPNSSNIFLEVDVMEMVRNVFMVMGIPLMIGIFITNKLPRYTKILSTPTQILSFIILLLFLVFIFLQNQEAFMKFAGVAFLLVVAHNTSAFIAGYVLASVFQCKVRDRKTISIETGIQNASIAFALSFTFFDGNGAMVFIAGLWGIWHLLSGGALAFIFSRMAN